MNKKQNETGGKNNTTKQDRKNKINKQNKQ